MRLKRLGGGTFHPIAAAALWPCPCFALPNPDALERILGNEVAQLGKALVVYSGQEMLIDGRDPCDDFYSFRRNHASGSGAAGSLLWCNSIVLEDETRLLHAEPGMSSELASALRLMGECWQIAERL